MKVTRANIPYRRVDDAIEIQDLFKGEGFAFDFVVGRIDGHHPKVINKTSDRAYFILSGELVIIVGDKKHSVTKDDLVKVPSNTVHAIEGKGEYIIITSPPFKPENEEYIS